MIVSMKKLVIDTSTPEGIIALTENAQVKQVLTCPSKEFVTVVAPLVEASRDSLQAIAIGIGPGSYAGTRAGVTFAKTLAFALNIPIIGFYSPLIFVPKTDGPFTCTLPAKGGEICQITGIQVDGVIVEHSDPYRVFGECPPQGPINLPPLIAYLERCIPKDVEVSYLYNVPIS